MLVSTDFEKYDYRLDPYYILSRRFPISIELIPTFNQSDDFGDQGNFVINLRVGWAPGHTLSEYFNKYMACFVKKGFRVTECREKINEVVAECNTFITDIVVMGMNSVISEIIEPKINELRSHDSKYYPQGYQFSYKNASYQKSISELLDSALKSPESRRYVKVIFNNCYTYLSEYIHQFVVHQMRFDGYIPGEEMFNKAIDKSNKYCEIYTSTFGTTFFYPEGFNYEVGGTA